MTNYSGGEGLWAGRFTLSGCYLKGGLSVAPDSTDLFQAPIVPPLTMGIYAMQFNGTGPQTGQLLFGPSVSLKTGQVPDSDTTVDQIANDMTDVSVLGWTPESVTYLVYPHQYREFTSQDVFFEQDDANVYFVTPQTYSWVWMWSVADQVNYGIQHAPVSYYQTSRLPAVAYAAPTPRPVVRRMMVQAPESAATSALAAAVAGGPGGTAGTSRDPGRRTGWLRTGCRHTDCRRTDCRRRAARASRIRRNAYGADDGGCGNAGTVGDRGGTTRHHRRRISELGRPVDTARADHVACDRLPVPLVLSRPGLCLHRGAEHRRRRWLAEMATPERSHAELASTANSDAGATADRRGLRQRVQSAASGGDAVSGG